MFIIAIIIIVLIIYFAIKAQEVDNTVNKYDYPKVEKKPRPAYTETPKKEIFNTYSSKAVFIDTETTGLNKEDEFIEITAILTEFDKQGNLNILDEYTGLRQPRVKINPKAQKVHGITKEKLEGKRIDEDKLLSIITQSDFIVAHNATFDKRFVLKEFGWFKNKKWLCSMNGIKWQKLGFKSKGLQNLLVDHNIEVEKAHRTRDDVLAMINLLNCKATPKTTYFNQLLRNNRIRQKDIVFEEITKSI